MSLRPDDHRKQWDKSEYSRLALERILNQFKPTDKNEDAVQRGNLRQRDYKVDLDSKLGKSVIIKNTHASQSSGYYCNACDCVVRDSINFLDHINGQKHQRNLGMTMKVERSTVEQVRERLRTNKKKLEEKQILYNLETRLREVRDEADRYKEHYNVKRKDRKRKAESSTNELSKNELNEDLPSLMGFSEFGNLK